MLVMRIQKRSESQVAVEPAGLSVPPDRLFAAQLETIQCMNGRAKNGIIYEELAVCATLAGSDVFDFVLQIIGTFASSIEESKTNANLGALAALTLIDFGSGILDKIIVQPISMSTRVNELRGCFPTTQY